MGRGQVAQAVEDGYSPFRTTCRVANLRELDYTRVMTDHDVSAQFGETVRPGQLVGVRIELVLQPPVQGEDHKVTGFASIKRKL